MIHALRRNVDMKILLFNNQIYGLTKGQYSPTSEAGKTRKSSPYGSIDYPFNPVSLAIGAEATFVARTLDMDRNHTQALLQAAYEHEGSTFIEIYQNCNVFNDKAFIQLTGKGGRSTTGSTWGRQADRVRRRRQGGGDERRPGDHRRLVERRPEGNPGP